MVSSGVLSGFALSSFSCGPATGGGTDQRGVVGDCGDALGCCGDDGGFVPDGVVAGGVVVVGAPDVGGFAVAGGFADGALVVGGVVGVDGVELQAAKDVAGTNTLPPPGVAHSVPPGTNWTLPLPGGSPAGHCTLWPWCVQQLCPDAVEARKTSATITAIGT
jgi:hypothetical protein